MSKEQEILNKYMGLVEDVKQGNKNALDVGTQLKEFYDSIESLYEEIKPFVVEERDKYPANDDVYRNGYKIRTMSRSYVQYEEDDEYSLVKQKLDNRKELIKKATKKGKPLTDSETGETVAPVSVKTTTYPVMEYVGEQQL